MIYRMDIAQRISQPTMEYCMKALIQSSLQIPRELQLTTSYIQMDTLSKTIAFGHHDKQKMNGKRSYWKTT